MASFPPSILCLLLLCYSTGKSSAQETRFDYPRANLSTVWSNWPGERGSVVFTRPDSRNITIRALLLVSPASFFGTTFACGFHRSSGAPGYTFSVLMVYVNSGARITMQSRDPVVVWSANRNRLVGDNATVSFTREGNLLLVDENQNEVWSSITSGQSVTAMEILRSGNLVLLNSREEIVWQSFDSPTDTLVSGQWLRAEMRLISAKSLDEPSTEGDYFLELASSNRLTAYVGKKNSSSPTPQAYWSAEASSAPYLFPQANGSIIFFTGNALDPGASQNGSNITEYLVGYHFLRLTWNGSLLVFNDTIEVDNLLNRDWLCELPQGCGPYSLCTRSGTCSCSYISSAALLPVNERASELGCRLVNPLSSACNSTNTQGQAQEQYIERVDRADYFGLSFLKGLKMDSIDACQNLCLNNCSCKAAFFVVDKCFVLDELYSLREPWKYEGVPETPSSALIKLQKPIANSSPDQPLSSGGSDRRPMVLALSIGIPLLLAAVSVMFLLRMRQRSMRKKEELALDVPGAPRRFSYKELCTATQEFSKKLGEGGFGSVFLGELPDGSRVAVKRLESSSQQGHKEFRAEVITIGSIHHFNLVQLRGFCAEGDLRLLVYELAENRSLDSWLFQPKSSDHDHEFNPLSWETRLRIALGTARGLAYLHEGCRERIIHLDIKPQNILLDSAFNAKVCDFGMSKLMTREDSHVFTMMRGTRGYLAPEWLRAMSITEKVDVFSYGIVLLELVSGKRCLDNGRVESSKRYLAEWALNAMNQSENRIEEQAKSLAELVDASLMDEAEEESDRELVMAQVEAVLRIATECIREEPDDRPSMGSIVQELERIHPEVESASRGGPNEHLTKFEDPENGSNKDLDMDESEEMSLWGPGTRIDSRV